MHAAAMVEDCLPLEMLVTAGAPVNVLTATSAETALHFAAAWDNGAAAKALLGAGAATDIPSAKGATALHRACAFSAESVARLLLEAGADIDAADKNGRTPLHVAAAHGATTLIVALLSKGADATICDGSQRRAVDIAKGASKVLLSPQSDDFALVEWLESKGLSEHMPLFQAHGLT